MKNDSSILDHSPNPVVISAVLATLVVTLLDLVQLVQLPQAVSFSGTGLVLFLPSILVGLPVAVGMIVLVGIAITKAAERRLASRGGRLLLSGVLLSLPILTLLPPLFSGRAISGSIWKYPLLLLVSLVTICGYWFLARIAMALRERRAKHPVQATLLSFVMASITASALYAATTKLYVGLYESLHQAIGILVISVVAVLFFTTTRMSSRLRPTSLFAVLLALALLSWSTGVYSSRFAPVSRSTYVDHAPFTGSFVGHLLSIARHPFSRVSYASTPADRTNPFWSVEFTENSERKTILLITVDALRGDAVDPQGGQSSSLMPQLEALARRGLYFDRAYAPGNNTRISIPALALGYYDVTNDVPGPTTPVAVPFGNEGYITELFFTSHEFADFDNSTIHSLTQIGFSFFHYHPKYDSAHNILPLVTERLSHLQPEQHAFIWVHLSDVHSPFLLRTAPKLPTFTETYNDEVSRLDTVLSPFLTKLTHTHPDLIWVISSDHGESLGDNNGIWFHGSRLYDAQVRVPLIIGGQSIQAGVIDSPVSLTHLGATLLRLAGAKLPNDVQTIPLGNEGTTTSPPVFLRGKNRQCGVVVGDWKLIVDAKLSTSYLFNVKADPDESHNLVFEEKERASRYLKLLHTQCPYAPGEL